MEKGSHCPFSQTLVRLYNGPAWHFCTPGLHTQDPVPGADLVSTCTADRGMTKRDQPVDLSQKDGYNTNSSDVNLTKCHHLTETDHLTTSTSSSSAAFVFRIVDYSCCEMLNE